MALGKGLGSILAEVELAYESEIDSIDLNNPTTLDVRELNINSISPNPYQPRKYFNEESLNELTESIIEHGLLQPIVVIKKDIDKFLLVSGERRLRAHKIAKIDKIQAIIANIELDSLKLRELALIENIQRDDLNAMELANSYAQLIDEHKIRHEDLAKIVHKSRSHITNTMRLLNLSNYAQDKLISQLISQGHAKIIVGIDDDKQKIIVDTIIGRKLTVRETENLVRKYKVDKKIQNIKKVSILGSYENKFKKLLPFKHKIKGNNIEISFINNQEIENFLSLLKKV
ncbi:Chromosome (plasmid) partitioning protein ParB [hydrothermal vent metagenome]|uniref:Chromosome (Plasmid) partitioning protein ParB n=1 Tax=hydrothermal vent metagenome TaxID=652676 RepID=A0A1W1EJ93_9ZZZZ